MALWKPGLQSKGNSGLEGSSLRNSANRIGPVKFVIPVDETHQDGHLSLVKFVRIKFESHEEEAKAFHGLIQRGRVISLRDDEFIVPAPALDWLTSQNFTPTVLAWLNL